MVGEPAVGPVIHVPKGNRLVEYRILQVLGFLYLIAEFSEAAPHQRLLEKAGVPGGAGRLNGNTFARHLFGSMGRYATGHGQGCQGSA